MNPQFVTGEVVTAAKENELPKGVLGYAQVTATQGGITNTEVDLTGLTVTVTVVANRRLRISSHTSFSTTVGDSVAYTAINEGATRLASDTPGSVFPTGTSQSNNAVVIVAPSTGTHTYKLRAARFAGTGTLTMGPAANNPAFILVEDIGGTI